MKGKLLTEIVFISSELIAADMAAHHLIHKLILQDPKMDIMQTHLLLANREIKR